MTARANGGTLRLASVTGHADVEVWGGSVDLRLVSAPDARLRANGGSIRLTVDPGAAFNLVAATTGGTVTIVAPLVPALTGSQYQTDPSTVVAPRPLTLPRAAARLSWRRPEMQRCAR